MKLSYASHPCVHLAKLLYVIYPSRGRHGPRHNPRRPLQPPAYIWGKRTLRVIKQPSGFRA